MTLPLLLSGNDLSGLAIFYVVVIWGGASLIALCVWQCCTARDARFAWMCYAVAVAALVAFPGFACAGNHTVPPDYAGGYIEMMGAWFDAFREPGYGLWERLAHFFVTAPAPVSVLLVIGAPLVRARLHPGASGPTQDTVCRSCGERYPSKYYFVEHSGGSLCRKCATRS